MLNESKPLKDEKTRNKKLKNIIQYKSPDSLMKYSIIVASVLGFSGEGLIPDPQPLDYERSGCILFFASFGRCARSCGLDYSAHVVRAGSEGHAHSSSG